MSIGLALIVIFILYLIDKHNLWRHAAKVIGAVIVFGILGVGGFYGETKYDEYRIAKRASAEQAAYQKNIQDCIARNSHSGTDLQDVFDQVAAQDACDKDPSTMPPCWSKPASPGGFQFDQNNELDLNGKRVSPDSKTVCYPITLQAKVAPDCKDELVFGCVDNSSAPWKKYGLTRIYVLGGKQYEVPRDTSSGELDAAVKLVSKDPGYAKASREDQKAYLAYVIENNRKKK